MNRACSVPMLSNYASLKVLLTSIALTAIGFCGSALLYHLSCLFQPVEVEFRKSEGAEFSIISFPAHVRPSFHRYQTLSFFTFIFLFSFLIMQKNGNINPKLKRKTNVATFCRSIEGSSSCAQDADMSLVRACSVGSYAKILSVPPGAPHLYFGHRS